MKKYRIAVLDDCQNVALKSADWSVLRDRADIAVFQNHLADPEAVMERLLPWLDTHQGASSNSKSATYMLG